MVIGKEEKQKKLAYKEEAEQKIIEQLPPGVSIADFWRCAKLFERDVELGLTGRKEYNMEGLENKKLNDIVVVGTVRNLPKLLKEIRQEYKGGGV